MGSRVRRLFGIGTAIALLCVVASGIAVVPAGADTINIPLSLTPKSNLEYGQAWEIQGGLPTGFNSYNCDHPICPPRLVVSADGTWHDLGPWGGAAPALYVGSYDFQPTPLGVGKHTLIVKLVSGSYTVARSNTPITITITKAPVTATTVIAADPNNDNNAIVTSQLSGDYIQQLCECGDTTGFTMPAGTWKLAVTNSAGKSVYSAQLDQKVGGLSSYVNYWQNVPSGENFTATSSFTPDASSDAANFSMTSTPFSYTSAGPKTTVGVTSPSKSGGTPVVTNTGFAPPLYVFYLALLVAILLAAASGVLLVRRSRTARPTPAVEEGAQQ